MRAGLLLLGVLGCAACASARFPTPDAAVDQARPADIAVLSPHGDLGFVEASGTRSYSPEWSEAAISNLRAAASKILEEKGWRAAPPAGDQAFRDISIERLAAVERDAPAVEAFDWRVEGGSGDAYALALWVEGDVHSAGHRAAEAVVGVFFGLFVPPSAGVGETRAALIDPITGDPVWFAREARATARTPEEARDLARRLFRTFPERDAL